ncbi:NUDIX domain-containing protein [Alphaproteobacteria bacterium KMM 3653]|uniref:NUDIX domain-containing protein n=1 Tax=Harenicola maris TaxID=2841044 RepID=A0AAP2CRZ8_9RHOB|nr:NUDIX domain-containing protein [Harenicola maris]
MSKPPRLAARAVLLHQDRLLLVNAWPGQQSPLWCAPGGGVEAHSSLPANLAREVMEECGLEVEVGAPCLVNEFHDRGRDFHQVEVFFRCRLLSGDPHGDWADTEGVVNRRIWATREEAAGLMLRPARLPDVAWGGGFAYDPLEALVR